MIRRRAVDRPEGRPGREGEGIIRTAHALPVVLLLIGSAAQADPIVPRADDSVREEEGIEDITGFDLQQLLATEIDVGTAVGSDLRSAPASVEVLTAEQIERLGIADVRELLLHFTGVYEAAYAFSPLVSPTTRLRGQPTASRILVLIDDHPQLNILSDHHIPYAVPIGSIERAEFLRGPAAVLYGSTAMAGTLRLVTKKASENGAGTRIVGDPVGRGGSVEMHGQLRTKVRGQPLRLRADLQARQSEDARVFVPADDDGVPGRNPLQVSSVASIANVQLGSLSLRLHQAIHRCAIFGLVRRFAFDPGPSSVSVWGAELGYARSVGAVRLRGNVALDYQQAQIDVGRLPPEPFFGRSAEQNRTVLSAAGFALNARLWASYRTRSWNGSLGVQNRSVRTIELAFRYRDDGEPHPGAFPPDSGVRISETNLFFQGSVTPTESLSLLVGGRGSYYRLTSSGFVGLTNEEMSPEPTFAPMGQTAVVWKVHDDVTAKAMYGRSYRQPTLAEMFSEMAGYRQPNPTIEPELQDTYELALDMVPVDRVTVRLSAFHSRVFHRIDHATSSAGLSIYGNVGGWLQTTGVDVLAHWSPLSVTTVEASFTYQVARDDEDVPLRSMPRTVGVLRLYQSIGADGGWKLSPSVKMRGPMWDTGTDVMVNVAVLWSPVAWADVSLTALNIFDRHYYLPYEEGPHVDGYARRTRTLRLGVSIQY